MTAERVIAAFDDAMRRYDEPHHALEHPARVGEMAAAAHRLRALIPEPPTDGAQREELADLLLRHGHSEWDRFDAETVADVILASPVWRNRGRGPITDEAVEAAWNAYHNAIGRLWDRMRIAIEAAEAHRA